MTKYFLPILCLIFFCLSSSYGQQIFKTTSSSVIGYLEYLPQDYNANSDKYPIVFFLHGVGERGVTSTDPATLATTIQRIAKHGPPMHVKNGYQFPFILISPQLKDHYGSWSSAYVMEVINHVKTYLRIDERRIYVTGLSLGGGGTWVTAQDNSALFAAIAPVCGGYNSTSEACNLAGENLPVWAFHGDADSTVPLSRSVNMINAINNCAPTPNPLAKMTIYPNVGHNAWSNAYRTDHSLHNPNVYEWMMSFVNTTNNGNKIPVADAGPDLNVSLLNPAIINGSGSDADGTIASYTWTKISGPASSLTNALTKTLTVSGLALGTYVFRLTIKDNSGNSDSDYVTLNVSNNTPPVANAGADKSITLPVNSISINGSGSDADGSIASYAWSKVSGGAATLSGTNTATLNTSGLVAGSYGFRLTVTDNQGATQSDDMTVTVNASIGMSANAGPDQMIALPVNSISITGTGTAAGGRVIRYYKWSKVSGPSATLNDVSKQTVYVHSMKAGIYEFKLTVTDNMGATATDNVQVIVSDATSGGGDGTTMPSDPVLAANAGPDQTITLPTNSLSITGTGTAEPDHVIRYYKWSKVSGPSATLNDVSKPTVYIHSMKPGIFVFKLTVTDNEGATATDEVRVVLSDGITVIEEEEEEIPNGTVVANAGSDQVITIPTNSLSITGSGYVQGGGNIWYYKWKKISGPPATLNDVSKPTVLIHSMDPGTFVFQLTVTDDRGVTGTDQVQVTVRDASTSATSFSGPEQVLLDESTPNIDESVVLGKLGMSQLENSLVVIYNDAGDRVYAGAWDRETYAEVFQQRGLYIYNVIKEGKRVNAGKIYIEN